MYSPETFLFLKLKTLKSFFWLHDRALHKCGCDQGEHTPLTEQVHVDSALGLPSSVGKVGFDVLKWFFHREWLRVKQNVEACPGPEGFSQISLGRGTGGKV